MTGCTASRFEYQYNAPPTSFQAQLPPFWDRRQRIAFENNVSAAQAAFSGQMCPEGHRCPLFGCHIVRRFASSYWHGPPGDGCELSNPIQDRSVQPTRHRDLGKLKSHISSMAHHFATDLDQLVPQCRQGPVLHTRRQYQPSQKATEVVCQHVQL